MDSAQYPPESQTFDIATQIRPQRTGVKRNREDSLSEDTFRAPEIDPPRKKSKKVSFSAENDVVLFDIRAPSPIATIGTAHTPGLDNDAVVDAAVSSEVAVDGDVEVTFSRQAVEPLKPEGRSESQVIPASAPVISRIWTTPDGEEIPIQESQKPARENRNRKQHNTAALLPTAIPEAGQEKTSSHRHNEESQTESATSSSDPDTGEWVEVSNSPPDEEEGPDTMISESSRGPVEIYETRETIDMPHPKPENVDDRIDKPVDAPAAFKQIPHPEDTKIEIRALNMEDAGTFDPTPVNVAANYGFGEEFTEVSTPEAAEVHHYWTVSDFLSAGGDAPQYLLQEWDNKIMHSEDALINAFMMGERFPQHDLIRSHFQLERVGGGIRIQATGSFVGLIDDVFRFDADVKMPSSVPKEGPFLDHLGQSFQFESPGTDPLEPLTSLQHGKEVLSKSLDVEASIKEISNDHEMVSTLQFEASSALECHDVTLQEEDTSFSQHSWASLKLEEQDVHNEHLDARPHREAHSLHAGRGTSLGVKPACVSQDEIARPYEENFNRTANNESSSKGHVEEGASAQSISSDEEGKDIGDLNQILDDIFFSSMSSFTNSPSGGILDSSPRTILGGMLAKDIPGLKIPCGETLCPPVFPPFLRPPVPKSLNQNTELDPATWLKDMPNASTRTVIGQCIHFAKRAENIQMPWRICDQLQIIQILNTPLETLLAPAHDDPRSIARAIRFAKRPFPRQMANKFRVMDIDAIIQHLDSEEHVTKAQPEARKRGFDDEDTLEIQSPKKQQRNA